jgi:4-hydroxy-4-methyl-2-oxoglutarate aldolase
MTMLKVYNEFTASPSFWRSSTRCWLLCRPAAVFADVQYRTGVMDSGIKPAVPRQDTGQALTVQLSKGDLVDPLKALEMGQPGDVIVVDAGGDPATPRSAAG